MKPELLTQHEMEEIGLEEAVIGPYEVISQEIPARGFAHHEDVALETLEASSWYPISSEHVEHLKVCTSPTLPGIYCVRSRLPDEHVTVRVTPAGCGIWRGDGEDHEVFLDLRSLSEHPDALMAARIDLGTRDSCVLRRLDRDKARVGLASFMKRPPVTTWLATSNDPWLVETLPALMASRDVWAWAVAVGRYARLRAVSADERRAVVDALLRGEEVDPRERRPLDWVRGMSRPQRQMLERLLREKVKRLRHDQEELLTTVRPEDDDWKSARRALLISRDDVESVCYLLDRSLSTPPDARPDLEAFDREGRAVLEALPEPADEPTCTLLARAATYDQEAWWARLME